MKKEELLKFYQAYKLFIFPAVVALSSLFLIVFAIIPQTTKLLDNQKVASDLLNKSKFLETKASILEDYSNNDLSQQVENTLSVFPQEKDFGNILGLLQQLTAQSGFSVVSISLGESGSKLAETNSYSVKLQVKGVKVLFQTLLNNLDNSLRLIRVSSIDVSTNQAFQTIDASLTLDALYSSVPQSFGTVDAPLSQLTQQEEGLLASLASTVEAERGSSTVQPVEQPVSPRGKSNPFE
ncbi:hypothetical protein HYU93_01095 [Candidatus Daviesbacteria bacterium]|nr:hypothetical protein [Candidatus Daviesbacteria bacterium]